MAASGSTTTANPSLFFAFALGRRSPLPTNPSPWSALLPFAADCCAEGFSVITVVALDRLVALLAVVEDDTARELGSDMGPLVSAALPSAAGVGVLADGDTFSVHRGSPPCRCALANTRFSSSTKGDGGRSSAGT